MLGMELYEFVSFLRQLGLALSGAACFWGVIFIFLARKKETAQVRSVIMEWMARRLWWLLYGGGTLALFAWTFLIFMMPSEAHEGITLISRKENIFSALFQITPVYFMLAAVLLSGLVFGNFRKAVSAGGLSWFYFLNFVLISVAISYYTDLTHLPANEIIFHIFHGFHSIFTLGTVLVLDFIFLSSRSSALLQQEIFPIFPQISKAIWIGLSLDLISVLLIFPEAVILSPRFFFAQTVVGIIIINGVLLSGVLTRRILENIENGREEESKKWTILAHIAGTVSVTSWMAITFVDFFPNMTLSYVQMISIYLVVIAVLFSGHTIWEKFDTEEPSYI